MVGVEGRVVDAVQRDAGKDEKECVRHEGGRVGGKAEGLAQVTRKDGLGSVVGHGQGGGDADNVLDTCAPPVLVDGAVQELVKVSVVHLK